MTCRESNMHYTQAIAILLPQPGKGIVLTLTHGTGEIMFI